MGGGEGGDGGGKGGQMWVAIGRGGLEKLDDFSHACFLG